MLTRSLALKLGEHGIRANAVLPGYIDVPEGAAHLDEAYRLRQRRASLGQRRQLCGPIRQPPTKPQRMRPPSLPSQSKALEACRTNGRL